MLLDKYVLTKELSTLLSHSPSASASATAQTAFAKRVNQSMGRVDPLLKTLQVRPSPPEGLVQAYLIHIGDRSDTNFRKILEMKGVRKQDQPTLVELFTIHRDGKTNPHLVQMSPLMTPLLNSSSMGSVGLGIGNAGGLGGASTPILPTKFDPAGFGEKLFSAARDGVERMGTPTVSGVASPLTDDAKAAVEGNLKSIGKFFGRDMRGFGRFGKGSVDDTVR
jgi:hypothetical protein